MLKNLFTSKWFRWVSIGVGALILLLVVFRLGMVVGEKKADFGYRWGENYGRFFGEPRKGFFQEFSKDAMAPKAFGDAGTVLKIEGNVMVVNGNDNNEKTILIGSSTIIRGRMQTMALEEIKPGDPVVVIGSPNSEGQIEAKFIRIFPEASSTEFGPNGQLPPPFPGQMPR